MDTLAKEILKIGLLPALLFVLIFLIFQDPDRIPKLKAVLTEPFFKLFKWFSKEHISSKVSSAVNEYFKKDFYSSLVNTDKYNFKVKWVSNTSDPVLNEDGSLILRLKEEPDQTKNILTAVHVALPHVICPLTRNNISLSCSKSIDLAILQKLSFKLGMHGKATFKRYFLDPETKKDEEIGHLISELIKLDKHGFFVPIFLNELELIGEGLYAENDTKDYTNEALDFIKYLISIVDRDRGEHIELNYLTSPFKIGTILLAKAQRADKQGLRPYLKRLRIKLDKGCESVYFIAFPPAFPFFSKLISTLDGHERIFIKNVISTSEYEVNGSYTTKKLKIALLRKNDIFTEEAFQTKIELNNIEIGKKVTGIVEHISQNETLVNVLGIRSYINREDCSWLTINDCSTVFNNDEEYDFIIKSIDKSSSVIHLTRKFEEDNPWVLDDLPSLNQNIEVEFTASDEIKFIGLFENRLEVFMLNQEASWFLLSKEQRESIVNSVQEVKVVDIDEDNQKLFVSLKQLEEDPWPIIHKSLTKGKQFDGRVTSVTNSYVEVEIVNGYRGRVPKESLLQAGHEYANFSETVVVGQGLSVVVSKVFIKRQIIRFDLSRNN